MTKADDTPGGDAPTDHQPLPADPERPAPDSVRPVDAGLVPGEGRPEPDGLRPVQKDAGERGE